jgi:nicotinate phosphoribosyltransferase
MIPAAGMLLTDLYQLTMLAGYFEKRMEQPAVFEFFVRKLPRGYGYLVAAGLEQVLDYLEDACFTQEELDWLDGCGRFRHEFVDYLRAFRFTGEVHAMPEGTVFFPDEPVLRVTAPLPQAQLVETRIINLLQYQILVSTKASRCVNVAPGKLLVDFGLRRAHGAEAGLLAARACYLAGFSGTATTLAAPRFGVPVFGTMAHSFVEAHDTEMESFETFARAQPDNVVLLIDTYDTEAAAQKLVKLAPRLRASGIPIKSVRLDSGDLADHAFKVRRILDEGGLQDVRIFASGSLDENEVDRMLRAGAPIDGFGIGSKLDTSANAPCLDCAYKLMEYAGRARRKHSEGKANWPGRKQLLRRYDSSGRMAGDLIAVVGEAAPGEPVLRQAMAGGRRIAPQPSLEQARQHLRAQLDALPAALKALDAEATYPVSVSDGLRALAAEVDRWIATEATRDP